jgi:hypothetical protein
MISLILLVCLAASPEICREEHPPVEVVSTLSCITKGQLIAAQWLEEHPKWMLRGWQCRLGKPEKTT